MSNDNQPSVAVTDFDEELWTPAEVADALRIKPNTLAKWRMHRQNLPYYRLDKGEGKKATIRYRKSEVLAFLVTSRRETTRYTKPHPLSEEAPL